MRIFITGNPGVGKTTLLKKINEFCRGKGISTSGFITEEVREGKYRVGFELLSLKTYEKFNFASIYKVTPYKFGKYYLDIEKFDKVLEDIFCIDAEIYILDEIGKMEFFSNKFKNKIYNFLDSKKNIIASLHRDFVSEFKNYGRIYQLTYENREIILNEIKEEILKQLK
ncbi:MAG: NTPase [Dictyoglomaceae bacterium]